MLRAMGDFKLDGLMRYSQFIPRLYNYCLSLGFKPGHIMPSRAFCSDESQGFPIILMAKHFGTFPFNHGQVGGIVATDRHGPHAHHGEDMLIVQASHVGYDPDSRTFGVYRRLQTKDESFSTSCGKICHTMHWYQEEYDYAADNLFLTRVGGEPAILVDNNLLDASRPEGLFLHVDKLLNLPDGEATEPLRVFSTGRAYRPSPELLERLPADSWPAEGLSPIGKRLASDLFRFERAISNQEEDQQQIERNLAKAMPALVTSASPALDAARFNTQMEFDRTYRTLVKSEAYRGKNLLFIAGLHIDVSPRSGQVFPLTKFVPWAAFVQQADGRHYILEQSTLVAELKSQPVDNPHQIALDEAIQVMCDAAEVQIEL